MDRYTLEVFLYEIQTQCAFALNAIRGLDNVLPRAREYNLDTATRATLHAEVFRSIHSFLTHASNVSRLIWPPVPRKKRNESRTKYVQRCLDEPRVHRGRALRNLLLLPKAGNPIKNRELRNHLEHFDERLDHWAATSQTGNYVQDLIGDGAGFVGVDAQDIMRWYDPANRVIRFRGEIYHLEPMVRGIADIRARAEERLSYIVPRF